MADKIILLNNGSIEQAAQPEEFYNQPQTTFVASFIGHPPMNLISSKTGVIGVRPEAVSIVDTGGMDVIVQGCDYQGAETIVSVDYCGSVVKACLPGKCIIPDGDTVQIQWNDDAEHHFDQVSGCRV